jgi:hypothetical protein
VSGSAQILKKKDGLLQAEQGKWHGARLVEVNV